MDMPVRLLAVLALLVGTALFVRLLRRRRRLAIGRAAHELALQFSPTDLFDLPRRYSHFVLPSAGHSPRAENVVYGHRERFQVRAFDFLFEVGHGPRRLARRCGALVAETDVHFPPVLLWHARDTEHPPLAAAWVTDRAGPWLLCAGEDFGPRVCEAFAAFADEPVSIQILGQTVLLSWPARWRPEQLPGMISRLVAAVENLSARARVDLKSPA
jgi:hypothetical protein